MCIHCPGGTMSGMPPVTPSRASTVLSNRRGGGGVSPSLTPEREKAFSTPTPPDFSHYTLRGETDSLSPPQNQRVQTTSPDPTTSSTVSGHTGTASSLAVDPQLFLNQCREVLSKAKFDEFCEHINKLNSGEHSPHETLQRVKHIFGEHRPFLFSQLTSLVNTQHQNRASTSPPTGGVNSSHSHTSSPSHIPGTLNSSNANQPPFTSTTAHAFSSSPSPSSSLSSSALPSYQHHQNQNQSQNHSLHPRENFRSSGDQGAESPTALADAMMSMPAASRKNTENGSVLSAPLPSAGAGVGAASPNRRAARHATPAPESA
eukprot:TRINITY_DN2363_c0_g2::TRINITY_DN2363_c0_g2_i1::g.20733::m.20733 TRINITY_DN2363_c0_g2::TRINITY_DN2363_c0_g2_i1::g.20733  ORF type:complete len:317 (-),score=36.92,Glycoamylase/PF10091.4/2.9e+02,Glycoamylase/PF10091.4/0.055,ORC5_C/PF14630.1/0.17,Mito_fiss_reg/PF05308.6/1.1e+03,Mito_fiss_reg/PF05308.6/0.056 TRINITY_DN2363_c0_g2_i1:18-968(-)